MGRRKSATASHPRAPRCPHCCMAGAHRSQKAIKEPGRDDFHVVPFLKPEDWDDVEVVPTRFITERPDSLFSAAGPMEPAGGYRDTDPLLLRSFLADRHFFHWASICHL